MFRPHNKTGFVLLSVFALIAIISGLGACTHGPSLVDTIRQRGEVVCETPAGNGWPIVYVGTNTVAACQEIGGTPR